MGAQGEREAIVRISHGGMVQKLQSGRIGSGWFPQVRCVLWVENSGEIGSQRGSDMESVFPEGS